MSSAVPSLRMAAIDRLRPEIEKLSFRHESALQSETFLGASLLDSRQNEQRRAELVELVKQREVFGQE